MIPFDKHKPRAKNGKGAWQRETRYDSDGPQGQITRIFFGGTDENDDDKYIDSLYEHMVKRGLVALETKTHMTPDGIVDCAGATCYVCADEECD